MIELTATPCCDAICELGEGPRWDAARDELQWVDILAGHFYRGSLQGDRIVVRRRYAIDRPVGAAAPAAGGGWVLAAGRGFAQLSESGDVTDLALPESVDANTRMNDGACDPQGRFWAGSMPYDDQPGAGTLYRLEPDGTATAVLPDRSVPNGLGWSPDGTTMWFADSGEGHVYAFDFDGATGALSNRRTIIAIDEGDAVPDGIAVDDEGCLWLAVWGAGEVRRHAPDGELLARVRVPASQPSACWFGAGRLFITSARYGLDPAQLVREPDAGRLFAVDAGVGGPPATPWRGVVPVHT